MRFFLWGAFFSFVLYFYAEYWYYPSFYASSLEKILLLLEKEIHAIEDFWEKYKGSFLGSSDSFLEGYPLNPGQGIACYQEEILSSKKGSLIPYEVLSYKEGKFFLLPYKESLYITLEGREKEERCILKIPIEKLVEEISPHALFFWKEKGYYALYPWDFWNKREKEELTREFPPSSYGAYKEWFSLQVAFLSGDSLWLVRFPLLLGLLLGGVSFFLWHEEKKQKRKKEYQEKWEALLKEERKLLEALSSWEKVPIEPPRRSSEEVLSFYKEESKKEEAPLKEPVYMPSKISREEGEKPIIEMKPIKRKYVFLSPSQEEKLPPLRLHKKLREKKEIEVELIEKARRRAFSQEVKTLIKEITLPSYK